MSINFGLTAFRQINLYSYVKHQSMTMQTLSIGLVMKVVNVTTEI